MAEHAHTTYPRTPLSVTRVTPGRHYTCPFPPRSREVRRRAIYASRATHPDAALIDLCAEFDALTRAFLATDFEAHPDTPEGDAADAEQDRICAAQNALVSRLCALPIATREGAAALAGIMARHDLELFKDAGPDGFCEQRLVGALVGGLIGWPG